MTEVISVKFKDGGKAYYFDPAGHTVKKDDVVIVEMQSGREMGYVSEGNHPVKDEDIVQPLRKMQRMATEKDFKKVEENKEKEIDRLLNRICMYQTLIGDINKQIKDFDIKLGGF